jgi:hypothetical protein
MKMTEPKTKSIGTISADKAKKISGFADYAKAAATLTEARQQTTAAKAKVKDALKKQLKEEGDIDFSVESSGVLRVFKNLIEKKPRTTQAGPDLSEKF